MKLQSILFCFFIGASYQDVSDVLDYSEGDMTCSSQPVKFTRTQNALPCTEVSCFATKQTKNASDTTSSRTTCSSDVTKYSFIKSGKYAALLSFFDSSCDNSKLSQVDGLLATGTCYLVGNSYFKADCSKGGSVKSYSCTDSECGNCTVGFDGTDDVCSNSMKYQCISGQDGKGGPDSSAGSMTFSLLPLSLVFLTQLFQ